MIEVDLHSRKPIYEQLIENITMLVMRGALSSDEQVPSVRQLAVSLAVNPNTVQRAFTELERRGVLYSVSGKGRFVNGKLDSVKEKQKLLYLDSLKSLVLKMKSCGVCKDAVISLVNDIYNDVYTETASCSEKECDL